MTTEARLFGLSGVVCCMAFSINHTLAVDNGNKDVAGIESRNSWSMIQAKDFTIYYDEKYAADAELTKDLLQRTIVSLTDHFSDLDPMAILSCIDCHFYLHPEPNEKASDGRCVCITRGLENGRRHVEIHFLTRSRYSPKSKNSVGEFKQAEQTFHRYIVHEYASSWLGVIKRRQQCRWYDKSNDAPNWFWQGYQEYLGMTLSSAHSRNVTFAKYLQVVKNDPDRILVAFGYRDKTPRIVVESDYTDGFALLAFMHDAYGKSVVRRILVSDQDTFRGAMMEALQLDVPAFYDTFQQWLTEWEPSRVVD